MEGLKRILRNGLYSFKGLYGFLRPETYILVKIVNPVFQVICFSLIARHAYGNADITPYIIGNAFALCVYNAFFGVGVNLISERGMGTLKIFMASPCNKFNGLVSKSLFHIIDGAFTVLIGILTGVTFFKVRLTLDIIPLFILCLFAAMFTACAMGLFIGSIGLVTRDINLLLNLSSMLIMALSGINFPVEKLPAWLQGVSSILPLTNALSGVKVLLINGQANNLVYGFILKEFVLGIIFSIIAYIALKIMERLAKVKASLDIY